VWLDRIEEREEIRGLGAVPEDGLRNHGPSGGVRVLAAVFPDTRRIPLDVTRIVRDVIERRREEQDETRVMLNELAVHVDHGARRAIAVGGSGNHTPRLCDGVDAAFGARGRSQRRSVIEVAPPIPVAVPGLLERFT
jgi:hypothetical protein